MSWAASLHDETPEATKPRISSRTRAQSPSGAAARGDSDESRSRLNLQWHRLATRGAGLPPSTEHSLKGVGDEVDSEKPLRAAPRLRAQLDAISGGGRPLSEPERAFFEPRLGADLSQVRLHTGEEAEGAAEDLNARAFTVGQDIFFAAGRYPPAGVEGRRLLAHELTHVAQQQGAGGSAQLIHRQEDNPLKGYKTSQRVDYRAEAAALAAIKEKLGKYVGEKMKTDTRTKDPVKYVPQKDFAGEYAKYRGVHVSEVDVKDIGGFYNRPKNLIVLPERPQFEALLHEFIHKFANPSFLLFGNGVNEAVTQYFTNYILTEYKLSRGKGHADKVVIAEALEQTVGFDELARSYFVGPAKDLLDTLKKKIPGFDHVRVLRASAAEAPDWKAIADMFRVPAAAPPKK
jgi:hypothetical protein